MTEMKEKEESLLEKLTKYSSSDFYPFHMPGHKRRDDLDQAGFPNPYGIDITEIDGFDNLHHSDGILKDSMQRAADMYGTDHTYYLVNGSTCGILSAICGTTTAGGKILMARNSHISAYNGVILNRLLPEYVYPEYAETPGISGSVRAEAVEDALKADKRIQAVFLTSPTYEGVVSDVRQIAAITHRHGVPLIVDEAHGAHLPFAPDDGYFPASAIGCGADIVIQSLHKTLPAFTQTAVLHISGTLVDHEKVERYLKMFQSSSPSYVFMAGIERCLRYMDKEGREEMKRYEDRLRAFYANVRDLTVLRVFDREIMDGSGIFGWDPSKIIISTKRAGDLNGNGLAARLRETYHLEIEMAASDHVIALTSLKDTDEGFARLEKALHLIDKEVCGRSDGESKDAARILTPGCCLTKNDRICTPAEALDAQGVRAPFESASGMISKEFVYVYPPGIPVLVPGEKIGVQAAEFIEKSTAAGLSVQGLSDRNLSTILTVAQ